MLDIVWLSTTKSSMSVAIIDFTLTVFFSSVLCAGGLGGIGMGLGPGGQPINANRLSGGGGMGSMGPGGQSPLKYFSLGSQSSPMLCTVQLLCFYSAADPGMDSYFCNSGPSQVPEIRSVVVGIFRY